MPPQQWKKKRTCGINFFRRWAAKFLRWKYSFFLNNLLQQSYTQSYTASPRLKTLSDPGVFRQDLYNHAKMPHPGQSHNVVTYMCADVKHDSRSGGWVRSFQFARFSLPFYMPDIFVHALSSRVHDFSRLHSLPPSQDHKDGSLVVGTFVRYFFVKAGRRVLLLLLQWMHCLAQNLLRCPAADSLPFSQMLCCWSLPLGVMTQWRGCRSFTWWGILVPPKSTVS